MNSFGKYAQRVGLGLAGIALAVFGFNQMREDSPTIIKKYTENGREITLLDYDGDLSTAEERITTGNFGAYGNLPPDDGYAEEREFEPPVERDGRKVNREVSFYDSKGNKVEGPIRVLEPRNGEIEIPQEPIEKVFSSDEYVLKYLKMAEELFVGQEYSIHFKGTGTLETIFGLEGRNRGSFMDYFVSVVVKSDDDRYRKGDMRIWFPFKTTMGDPFKHSLTISVDGKVSGENMYTASFIADAERSDPDYGMYEARIEGDNLVVEDQRISDENLLKYQVTAETIDDFTDLKQGDVIKNAGAVARRVYDYFNSIAMERWEAYEQSKKR